MSGLLPTDAPFVRILLEGVQDSETAGLLTADDVAKAALDADIAVATFPDPTGSLYVVLGSGAQTVTGVLLLRETHGWSVADVHRTPGYGPRGLLKEVL